MKVVVVTPVFNDWVSLRMLCRDLEAAAGRAGIEVVEVVAVDDCSTERGPTMPMDLPVRILHLSVSLGHQRAIAVGLSYVVDNHDADVCVVMDSDGEDDPRAVAELCTTALAEEEAIAFAARRKREESLSFRISYRLYKALFKLLTGQKIDFGNFSAIPWPLLGRVVSLPDLWNHYSGGVIRSRLPFERVEVDRTTRYEGESQMNLQSLVVHGLSSIAVYSDNMAVRLLIASLGGLVLIGLAIILVAGLRLLTDVAIPGWASLSAFALVNLAGLLFVTTLLVLVMHLNQRNAVQRPVTTFYSNFIHDVEHLA